MSATSDLERDTFKLEGTDVEFEGFNDRTNWNGFANPQLGHDEALRAAQAIKAAYEDPSFDGEWHVNITEEPGRIDLEFEGEGEGYTESFIEVDGLFCVGHGWCWYSKLQHPDFF